MEKQKLAIVGAAVDLFEFPKEDFDGEIWTVARMAETLPYASRIFEMHKKAECSDGSYEHMFKAYKGKIVGLFPEAFPNVKMEKYTCPFVDVYGMVTNTICYMLAKAIEEKFEEIHLYAMPHSNALERLFQKSGVLYWLGLCLGCGISIVDHCGIIEKDNIYGVKE